MCQFCYKICKGVKLVSAFQKRRTEDSHPIWHQHRGGRHILEGKPLSIYDADAKTSRKTRDTLFNLCMLIKPPFVMAGS